MLFKTSSRAFPSSSGSGYFLRFLTGLHFWPEVLFAQSGGFELPPIVAHMKAQAAARVAAPEQYFNSTLLFYRIT